MFLRVHPIRVNIPKVLLCFLIVVSIVFAWCLPVLYGGATLSRGAKLFEHSCIAVWMLTLYCLMPSDRVYLKGYAFPIYLMHASFLSLIRSVMAMLGVCPFGGAVICFDVLCFVFAFCASMGVAYLLRRYLPGFARVAFGGR